MFILLKDVHLVPESDCTRVHSKLPIEKEDEVIKKHKGRRRRRREEGEESCLTNNSLFGGTEEGKKKKTKNKIVPSIRMCRTGNVHGARPSCCPLRYTPIVSSQMPL